MFLINNCVIYTMIVLTFVCCWLFPLGKLFFAMKGEVSYGIAHPYLNSLFLSLWPRNLAPMPYLAISEGLYDLSHLEQPTWEFCVYPHDKRCWYFGIIISILSKPILLCMKVVFCWFNDKISKSICSTLISEIIIYLWMRISKTEIYPVTY